MDKIRALTNMTCAFLLYPFTKNKFKNKRIWLVGGNAGEFYVDNGRAIYEYIRTKKEITEFWILNDKNTIREQIPGEVLIKGSIKSYLYFMNAEVVLFSHSISADIVPYLYVIPFLKKFHYKVLKVFLNHGTVGFKVRKALNINTEKIVEKMVQSYDLNICDSEIEKNIKTKNWWKVPEKSAYITGYPRYDKLYDTKLDKKKILFMPTWRPYLKENDNIKNTEYFKNIIGLLTNERLNKFLEIKDIKISIYIHQLMQKYLNNFDEVKLGRNVEILPKGTDITRELLKSNILITDYSSVAYDYLYMDKPIIFFQFDREEYEEKVGSYIDLETDLFGEKSSDIENCINKIVEIVKNDYKYSVEMEEKIKKLRKKFITYTDKENCRRVYELIEKKLVEKNEGK